MLLLSQYEPELVFEEDKRNNLKLTDVLQKIGIVVHELLTPD